MPPLPAGSTSVSMCICELPCTIHPRVACTVRFSTVWKLKFTSTWSLEAGALGGAHPCHPPLLLGPGALTSVGTKGPEHRDFTTIRSPAAQVRLRHLLPALGSRVIRFPSPSQGLSLRVGCRLTLPTLSSRAPDLQGASASAWPAIKLLCFCSVSPSSGEMRPEETELGPGTLLGGLHAEPRGLGACPGWFPEWAVGSATRAERKRPGLCSGPPSLEESRAPGPACAGDQSLAPARWPVGSCAGTFSLGAGDGRGNCGTSNPSRLWA